MQPRFLASWSRAARSRNAVLAGVRHSLCQRLRLCLDASWHRLVQLLLAGSLWPSLLSPSCRQKERPQ